MLRNKAFNIAKNPKYNGYQRGLASMVYIFIDKRSSSGIVKNEIISNKYLAEELNKHIIRKFEKRKLLSPFTGNIGGTDLSDMHLLSKFNKVFRFLLFVIDIYSKNVWVIPLQGKKETTITYAFRNN